MTTARPLPARALRRDRLRLETALENLERRIEAEQKRLPPDEFELQRLKKHRVRLSDTVARIDRKLRRLDGSASRAAPDPFTAERKAG